jgi:hypothetical protein
MKRLLPGLGAVLAVGAAVAWSGPRPAGPELRFPSEKRNPVTHLKLNNDPDDFQFAVVSDRTGGHRARVFSRAVAQLNLLQPEFVVSVGDLIEGYSTDRERIAREWREFQGYLSRLEMPFFYVPGNHDLANLTMNAVWKEKFGRSYYSFVYRGVLFLCLNSEDPPNEDGKFSAAQREWLADTLKAHPRVRWTLVFLHKPVWIMRKLEDSGWLEVEKLLAGRNYTVFAGHVHRYQKFVRQGQNYYMLATTGGGSRLRGAEHGEFDHVVWVTMKKAGPVIANLLLDGILPEDLSAIGSDEEGVKDYHRRPTQPVAGRVTLDGAPIPGALVALHGSGKEPGQPYADAVADAEGRLRFSTYEAFDGVPAGQYKVTAVLRKPFWTAEGKLGPNRLPAKYASADTTPIAVVIKSGKNEINLDLTSR